MRTCLLWITLAAVAAPAFAQREFLTNNEIEKIREAQDPNLRLKTYLLFARQRLDQLQQQVSKEKKGRSLVIRQLLEDYGQIIDAMDTVSDDALKRKVDIAEGVAAVAAAEKTFAAQLQKIQDSNPSDLNMYDLELKLAIENTQDSIESSKEDLGRRSEEVIAKDDAEKKRVEALTPKETLKEQKTEDAKAEPAKDDSGQPKRKPPTLYRPGEKPADSDVSKP